MLQFSQIYCRRIQQLKEWMFPTGYRIEAIQLFMLAWPAALTSLFQTMLLTINVIMCGHLGVTELAAIGLASSMLTVFGLDIGFGMCTACDSLFSQAFGSRRKTRVGMYLQRSFFVMFIFIIPLSALYMNFEPIFILFGQETVVSRLAGNFMINAIPSLIFYYGFMILSRYFQTQKIVIPPMLFAALGNIINFGLNYVALYVLKLEHQASAIAFVLSVFCMFFMQLLYLWMSKVYVQTWDGLQKEAIYDIASFLKMSLSGVMIVSLEQWLMEASVLVAGLFSENELGAQSIMVQFEALGATIQVGLSVAVSIRVGHHVGAGNVKGAWSTMWVALSFVPILGTIITSIYLLFSNYLPGAFTDNASVGQLVSSMLPSLAAVFIADVSSNVLSAVFRGFGRHEIGGIVCLITTYGINMPIGLLLAFSAEASLQGIWWGFVIGSSVQVIIFVLVLFKFDWEKQCEQARTAAGLNYDQTASITATPKDEGYGSAATHEANVIPQTISEKLDDTQNGGNIVINSEEKDFDSKQSIECSGSYDESKFRPTLIRSIIIYAVLIALFIASAFYHFEFYRPPQISKASNNSQVDNDVFQ